MASGSDGPADVEGLRLLMQDLLNKTPNMSHQKLVEEMKKLTTNATFNVGQMEALARQVMNSTGGYSYLVDDMMQLKRFLVLGAESGTLYIKQQDLLKNNLKSVQKLIVSGRGTEVLEVLEEYSVNGRVAKEDPILLVLATIATNENYPKLQKQAYALVNKICTIPTKLFLFNELCQKIINSNRETGLTKREPQKRKAKAENGPSPKKKKKKSEFKTINTKPKRSSGWGRMRRKAIARYYTDPKKDANNLLYQMTKYKQRNNWSHKQLLGYSHPKFDDSDPQRFAKNLVLTYCTRGFKAYQKMTDSADAPKDDFTEEVINNINVVQIVSELDPEKEGNESMLLNMFQQYGTSQYTPPAEGTVSRRPFQLVREHVPNGFLRCGKLWEIMLEDMPMMAMVRNLGTMTGLGVFSNEDHIRKVVTKLSDPLILKKARIHPIKILIAIKAYERGCGKAVLDRPQYLAKADKKKKKKAGDMEVEEIPPEKEKKGPVTWKPVKAIEAALNDAFYKSFKQPELGATFKTGKKFMLALDVSGSMNYQGCVGCEELTPAVASCALSLITLHIEDNCEIVAYGGHLQNIKGTHISKEMTVMEAVTKTGQLNFGSTDCSLPMVHALQNGIHDIDVFVVYTDSETYAGAIHPSAALVKYREETPMKKAKLIVMGMQSNGFSLADPDDPGMMDIVGFDANVPDIISKFVKDEF